MRYGEKHAERLVIPYPDGTRVEYEIVLDAQKLRVLANKARSSVAKRSRAACGGIEIRVVSEWSE